MALTADFIPNRRGAPPNGVTFGYPIAPSEKVYRGSAMAVNSSGQAQRVQTSGSLALIGLAERAYDNTANAAAGPAIEGMKGVYALTVSGASYGNIGQNVYATDDGTFSLSNAETAVYARGGSDTGTGTVGTITVSAGAKTGVYSGVILSGAATFSLTDPNGDALATGTLGSAYSSGGLAFTLSNSGTNFVATDTFTITVSESAGALLVGSIVGIDNSQVFVKLLGG